MTGKVIGSAASRSGPDAFEQSGDLDQLVPAGVVADLTSYWDGWADRSKFPAGAVGRRNGKVYSVKPYSNLIGLWYNADILDKLSITPPVTFDELGAALAKVKQAGYVGLAIAGDANLDAEWQARPFYSGFGFDYLHPDVAPLQETFELFTGPQPAGEQLERLLQRSDVGMQVVEAEPGVERPGLPLGVEVRVPGDRQPDVSGLLDLCQRGAELVERGGRGDRQLVEDVSVVPEPDEVGVRLHRVDLSVAPTHRPGRELRPVRPAVPVRGEVGDDPGRAELVEVTTLLEGIR